MEFSVLLLFFCMKTSGVSQQGYWTKSFPPFAPVVPAHALQLTFTNKLVWLGNILLDDSISPTSYCQQCQYWIKRFSIQNLHSCLPHFDNCSNNTSAVLTLWRAYLTWHDRTYETVCSDCQYQAVIIKHLQNTPVYWSWVKASRYLFCI